MLTAAELRAKAASDFTVKSTFGTNCSWGILNGILYIWPTTEGTATLPSISSSTGWPWYQYNNTYYYSRFSSAYVTEGVKASTSLQYMFYSCTALTDVDLHNLDTSACTNFNYMFQSCTRLQTLNLQSVQIDKLADNV